jgi:hypothetical protein
MEIEIEKMTITIGKASVSKVHDKRFNPLVFAIGSLEKVKDIFKIMALATKLTGAVFGQRYM